MPSFLKNFFETNYFKFYLIFIFIFSVLFLSQKFLYPTDWTTSEWLINYQSGFVRRGLSGELFFRLHEISEIPIRYLIFYFEIFVLIVFFALVYKFFQNVYLNELLIFLFFCPIFLLYPVAENEVLVRKEYLLLSLYIFYLILILNNNNFLYLVILIFLPMMNLVWDGMNFYIYFFIFSFFFKKNLNNRQIIYFFFSFLPYLISLYFIIVAKSDPIGLEQMCISINEKCYGAMLFLDKHLPFNIEFMSLRFKIEYLVRYLLLILICFSPILAFSYFDNLKLKIGNIFIKKSLLKLNLFLIFSIFMFMIIGFDWGRWINIGYSFSVFTLFFLIKSKEIKIDKNNLSIFFKNFSIKYNRIFYIIFFIYVFTWNMKAIMTDDIGSFPYYRIITKSIKIISLYI